MSAFTSHAVNFSVEVRNVLFQYRDLAGVIGLSACCTQQQLEPLDFVFHGIDLLLLFLIQSHLPGIPLGTAGLFAIPDRKRDDMNTKGGCVRRMTTDSHELYNILASAVSSEILRKAVFSSPAAAAGEIVRVNVRPLQLRGLPHFQIASRTATQEFHRNCPPPDALTQLRQYLDGRFRNLLLDTTSEQVHAILDRRGTAWKIHRRPHQPTPANTTAAMSEDDDNGHDRQPRYLIPPGRPCPFLQATGVMDQAGHVKSKYARKFRQINRFLEFVADITDALPSDRPLEVVDFGCGRSYLTFAVHHLLTVVQGRECRITGLDRRQDVVSGCQSVAQQLGLNNLLFEVGDIAAFTPVTPPDLVISLHACDTATDDAIAQAVRWSASAILAVPCCQQELQRLLNGNPLPPLTSWGIARERFCALATDTQRAALLDAAGYQTQLLEFIDMEHTPKNLLLRAVRVPPPRPERSDHEQQVLRQAADFRRLLGTPPLKLERLLTQNQLLPHPATPANGGPP